MAIEWHKYDRGYGDAPLPEEDKLVWMYDIDHGICLGVFDGYTWQMWWGSDDCRITHWALIEKPEPPRMEKEQ